jgi:hypothetical protein
MPRRSEFYVPLTASDDQRPSGARGAPAPSGTGYFLAISRAAPERFQKGST